MQIFSQTMAGPQMGNEGPDVTNAPPATGSHTSATVGAATDRHSGRATAATA